MKKTARARPQRTVPKVGSVIAKRYEVGKVLGTGGFGVVVEARQTNLDRRVAIKLIWHDIAQKQSNKVRFLNEARIYARIDNPHVVKVHDCGELPDGRLFLVMEYLEGQNLHELIQASGRLSVDDMRDICAQIAFGLAGAHDRGFVHRDIKPRNIMISKTADGRRFVKLLDFGLGHISDEVEDDDDEAPTAAELEKGVTMAGKTCGTPKYMSPEQIMAKDVDPRSDIYSLGICLYEMATGRVPFEGPDLPSFTAQHALEPHRPIAEWRKDDPLPSRLNGIIDTCLAKRPADRYRTAHSLVADLEELADELASERMAPTWTPSDDNGPSRMTAEVNQEADHEKEASNSELGNVTKAVRACSRSFKCLQLYPANSPFVTEALEAAAELLAGVLEKRPWIGLSIERSSMMFCGETVYEDEDLRDSLPFRLFDDGIRRLYIDAGIDVGEVRDLMSAIHESSLGTTREDLVTLLWERQLKHVRTVLIEDLVEEGGPGVEIINDDLYKSMGAVAPGDKQKARGRSGMSIGAEVVGRFEQELTPEATAALEALKADHEKEDAIKAFLKALSGMLTTTSDPKELAGIVRLFGDIAAMLLRAGSLRLGLKVLLILEKVEQTNTDEGVAEAIDAAFDAAANPKLIKKSLELLTEDESLRAYALRYLMLVAHAAAETVIDGLHLLPRETLPNIQMILLKAAKSDPAVLRTGLTSKYDQTVHAVMAVVLKVGGADAIQLLSPLLKHPAPRVRAASLAGISKLRPPKLQAYVETGIRDDVSEVRLVAMRASLRLGAEPARVLLMSIVVDGASHLPKLKQVTLFKTLARVADTRVVSGLARILEPSHDSGFTQMMLRASSRGLKRIGVDVDLERDAQFEDYKANVIRCLKLIDLPAAKAVLEKYG